MADTLDVAFLVALLAVLAAQAFALTPAGRRLRNRYVPGWLRRKYAFVVGFGLAWAVAAVLGALTSAGEGLAFALADLLVFFIVVMVLDATGMVEGRINDLFTTPDPKPDPWLLL